LRAKHATALEQYAYRYNIITFVTSADVYVDPPYSQIMSQSRPWSRIPTHILSSTHLTSRRLFSTSRLLSKTDHKLTHLTSSGSAHMVPISHKEPTSRTAVAKVSIHFTSPTAVHLIRENNNKKGDVLGVARIAGIMAAKKTSEVIPLCHPIMITHVSVELTVKGGTDGETASPWSGTEQGNASDLDRSGCVEIEAKVSCDGKTGVEMEALTAASVAALTVYDMCKAVDKGMRIEGLRVVRKEGGQSGTWVEGAHKS